MFSKFVFKIKGKIKRFFATTASSSLPQQISQNDLLSRLSGIPSWEKKIEAYNLYEYSPLMGIWQLKSIEVQETFDSEKAVKYEFSDVGYTKIHYGCGGNIIADWLNIDLYESDAENYYSINLLNKHPFPDNSVSFGFSEDVLEHLNQAQSIFFISEIYRTLKKDGVIRLSFPGLEGILKRHYTPYSEDRIRQGEFEAYSFWDHIHFYSKEELKLVAGHIGFKRMEFFEYRKSACSELGGLDTRADQMDLNTYVELTK